MSVLCVDVGCWALWSCGAVQLFRDEVSIYLLQLPHSPFSSFQPKLSSFSSLEGGGMGDKSPPRDRVLVLSS